MGVLRVPPRQIDRMRSIHLRAQSCTVVLTLSCLRVYSNRASHCPVSADCEKVSRVVFLHDVLVSLPRTVRLDFTCNELQDASGRRGSVDKRASKVQYHTLYSTVSA